MAIHPRSVSIVVFAVFLVGSVVGAQAANATFPGKNGKIAFASDRSGNSEIYVMNADGSDQRRLTF